MWPQKERDDLISKNRHPVSINIAKQKLETLNGSIMSEKFDFDFKPMDIEENSLTKSVKHWYYADKEQYNYGAADSETNISGLLHSGTQEIGIDYDIRRTGAISFEDCINGTVLKDPTWQTNRLKDWREAMKDGWLTAQQITDKYDTNSSAIQWLADQDYWVGERYEPTDDPRMLEDVPRIVGSRYLVTEYRWLEKLKTTRLHAKLPNGEWFALPLKAKESDVRNFLQAWGINWYDVKEFPYEDNILYYGTIAPQLQAVEPDLVLVRGKHPIQCGFIGFHRFSSTKTMGIEKGMFEYILDLNRTLNYRQSKMDDIIASAASGAIAIDKTKVGGDKGVRAIEQNKTRPDYVLGVDGSPDNIMSPFPIQQVPEHIFRQVNELIGLFDRVSPVTPALEGAATADESGILFEMRHAVTKLGTLRLFENWQQFLKDKAEAWYNQAQITYKDLYRRIPRDDGLGEIEFNAPAFREGPDGERTKVYINSVSELPRARVIIGLKRSSPTERMARRVELFDTTKMLSAHPELFKAEIRILTNDLIATIERTPEEQQKLARIQTLQELRDITEIMVQIEQLKAQGLEAKALQAQLTGMLQQVQGQLGAQGQPEAGIPEQSVPAGPPQETALVSQARGEGEPGASVNTFRGEFQP